MEKKKISFSVKNDIEMQGDWWEKHWIKCNYDCTEWKLKNLADAQNSTTHCYQGQTAKFSIWA